MAVTVKTPPKDHITDPLFDRAQTAAYVKVTLWVLDNELRKDPSHNFPACIWVTRSSPRWRRSALDAWLASRPQGGNAPSFNTVNRKRGRA